MSSQSTNIYGFPQPLTKVFPSPIISSRSPLSTDFQYPLGQLWINNVGDLAFILVDVTANSATWTSVIAPGVVDSLTGDGGVATPVATNINIIQGRPDQIVTSGAGDTITIGINPVLMQPPGNLTVSGAVTVANRIGMINGNLTLGNGNLVFSTAGNKFVSDFFATTIFAGANSFGTVNLMGGTATVMTTAINTDSLIILSRQDIGPSGILGLLSIAGIVNRTSFTIISVQSGNANLPQGNDNSKIGWMIIN